MHLAGRCKKSNEPVFCYCWVFRLSTDAEDEFARRFPFNFLFCTNPASSCALQRRALEVRKLLFWLSVRRSRSTFKAVLKGSRTTPPHIRHGQRSRPMVAAKRQIPTYSSPRNTPSTPCIHKYSPTFPPNPTISRLTAEPGDKLHCSWAL